MFSNTLYYNTLKYIKLYYTTLYYTILKADGLTSDKDIIAFGEIFKVKKGL